MTITVQLADGWRDAWAHEPRNALGEWTGRDLTQDALKDGFQTNEEVNEHAARVIAARWHVQDADLRALAAEGGYDLPADPAAAREAMADYLTREWRGSSGGPVITAAATHVADRLGLHYQLAEHETEPQQFIRAHPAMDRATASLGDAIYGATQDWLNQRGITRLHVMRSSRGVQWDAGRPFTSWSLDWGGLRHEGGRPTVAADVPAARVFSLPPTGPGTVAESEVVLLPAGQAAVGLAHAEAASLTAADILTEWHATAADLASPHLNRAAAALHAGDRARAAGELELAASYRRGEDSERLCRMAIDLAGDAFQQMLQNEARNRQGEWTRGPKAAPAARSAGRSRASITAHNTAHDTASRDAKAKIAAGRAERSGPAVWKTSEGTAALTPAEKNSIANVWYGRNFYATNGYLRRDPFAGGLAGDPRSIIDRYTTGVDSDAERQKYIADIGTFQTAVSKAAPFTSDVTLLRGVNHPEAIFGPVGSTIGKSVTDKGFTSATSNMGVADSYSHGFGGKTALITIHARAGSRALKVDPDVWNRVHTKKQGQTPPGVLQEYTFAPGTSYKILADTLGADGVRRMDMEVTP